MSHAALLEDAGVITMGAKRAGDLMTPNPVSIRDTAPISEALAFFIDHGISGAPVIDEAGRPVGVLTQTDLLIHERESLKKRNARFETPSEQGSDVYLEQLPDEPVVEDLMTPIVFATTVDTPATQVISDLVALKVHRLFVCDANGTLVGVVTALDVLRHVHHPQSIALQSHLPRAVRVPGSAGSPPQRVTPTAASLTNQQDF